MVTRCACGLSPEVKAAGSSQLTTRKRGDRRCKGNRVFDQDECIVPDHTSAQTRGNRGRTVIVEFTGMGAPRIREAPPDVLVTVAERKEITAAASRTVAAGGSGEVLSPDNEEQHNGTEVHQIRVEFPG